MKLLCYVEDLSEAFYDEGGSFFDFVIVSGFTPFGRVSFGQLSFGRQHLLANNREEKVNSLMLT